MNSVSGLAGIAAGGYPASPQPAAGQHADTQAVIAAKQARNAAQARVDADQRAHSPGCVAVDEKGLSKAEAQLAAAQSQAQQTQPGSATGSQVSILV